MKGKSDNVKLPDSKGGNQNQNDLNGYPEYPPSEDIYSKFKEEKDINPEDTSKTKEFYEKNRVGTRNEKDFNDDVSGSDLDIPDSDLDNDQKNTGIEDEENNYYSLGGDDHSDLEEDQGE